MSIRKKLLIKTVYRRRHPEQPTSSSSIHREAERAVFRVLGICNAACYYSLIEGPSVMRDDSKSHKYRVAENVQESDDYNVARISHMDINIIIMLLSFFGRCG